MKSQEASIKMVAHNCPVDGLISIEAGKACNWCGRIMSDDKRKAQKVH